MDTLEQPREDMVNHPPHYAGKIETIDYIVDVLGEWEAISYCHGNVLKYTGKRLFSKGCLLYTSPSPRDGLLSRMPSSA